MTPIEYLDKQVKQVCPNAHGVSIGKWNDKKTWTVTPTTLSATEIAAAQMVFDAFNVDTYVATPDEIDTLLADATIPLKIRKAIQRLAGR